MSGEMTTSFSNGISNMIIMNYVAIMNNLEITAGLVEGDDGLFSFANKVPTTEMVSEAGFTIKIKRPINLGDSEFCGYCFVEGQNENITDPYRFMYRFNYT